MAGKQINAKMKKKVKSMWKVTINSAEVHAQDGELLFDILMKLNQQVERPCGGKGTCKKCKVLVNGKEELSCQYKVYSDITVQTLDTVDEIVTEIGAEEMGNLTENLCYVLDIGTTTLVMALVSRDQNKIIKTTSRVNRQRLYGADVISRIEYCMRNGVKDLTDVLISEVNDMIKELSMEETNAIASGDTAPQTTYVADTLYVAGNTTMLHLFMGVDCSSIGVAPYTPVFLEQKHEDGKSVGLEGIKEVVLLPSISSFVGADLVAGLHYVGMPQENKYNLLVDLGTNAEIILFSREKVICTAAAAGPCFEGVNISCGMCATNGAIYTYSSQGAKTIGDAPAKGICGTGLIDVITELVRNETIDETGYMECEQFELAEGVYLTQQDIRQFQTAKSAISSAIITLMKQEKISDEDLDTVYVAGGFAAKLNVHNAVELGMLPSGLASKCVAVNNSSLLGTVKYACDEEELSKYTTHAEYIDLSANPMFSELFIDNLYLLET